MQLSQLANEPHEGLGAPFAFLCVLRHAIAVVLSALESGVVAVRARQKAVRHGRECHEGDIQLLEHGEQGFVPARHHGIAVLDGGDGAHRIGATQVLLRRLGDSPGADLTFLDEVCHGVCNDLGLDLWVDSVLVVEVDVVGAQPAQALLHRDTDNLGARVHEDGLVRGVRDAELGGNDNLVAHGRERLAHHVLVVRLGPIGARANVALRRVKEGIAHLVGLTDDAHGLVVGHRVSARVRDSHAAHAERADFDAAFSQNALVHSRSPCL